MEQLSLILTLLPKILPLLQSIGGETPAVAAKLAQLLGAFASAFGSELDADNLARLQKVQRVLEFIGKLTADQIDTPTELFELIPKLLAA